MCHYYFFNDLKSIEHVGFWQSIIIDMPVDLPLSIADYPRISDKIAKRLLKRNHGSIFYAPLRDWLIKEYPSINEECLNRNKPKLSKQSYYLFPKILEVQDFKIKVKKINIYESHPELFFLKKNSGQQLLSKKVLEGQLLRQHIIKMCLNQHGIGFDLVAFNAFYAQANGRYRMDDMIDSLAMLCVGLDSIKSDQSIQEFEHWHQRFDLPLSLHH